MLQLEVGLGANSAAARQASAAGAIVIMNAAPAPSLSDPWAWDIWRYIDILIVNRDEAEALSAVAIGDTSDAIQAAVAIRRQLGVERIVVTLGPDRAALVADPEERHVRGFVAPVVDTIGAGDAFAGAVGATLARGSDLMETVELGNAAGALAVGRKGAYDAPPRLDETREFVASRSPGVGKGRTDLPSSGR